MEAQNSPVKPIAENRLKALMSSPTYTKPISKSLFSRTIGKYVSPSSGHLQPPQLDYAELLRLVEELRDRESRLKTELLEHNLLKESLAIVPVLENEIYLKETEAERALIRIERLKAENERLKKELEEVHQKTEEERRKNWEMLKMMEDQIVQLKKTESDRRNSKPTLDDDESSGSRKFQRLMEVSVESSLISNSKERNECMDRVLKKEKQERKAIYAKNGADIERPNISGCNSEELAESRLFNQISDRSTIPKSPKRQQYPSWSNFPSKLQFPPASPPAVPGKPVSQPPPLLSKSAPPPPPPPPPPPLPSLEKRLVSSKVRRVPELVELYHSLMRRDSRKDCSSAAIDMPTGVNAHDMIGEIKNRSAHLLAIKMDVETKGDFIKHLIKEVESAEFTDIEDVVTFVTWLDNVLSYLVDERAVLKHFEWPEQKADALREAAFGYYDLKKLGFEVSSFHDFGRQPRDITLKKMQALLEKLEHGVYNLRRMRESATMKYKVFRIPMDWMLDTGIVCEIKLQSLKLVVEYLKRVSVELDTVYSCSKEQLIIEGIRFAFRVHQFAGGFDMEAVTAFQELREKVRSFQNQQLKSC